MHKYGVIGMEKTLIQKVVTNFSYFELESWRTIFFGKSTCMKTFFDFARFDGDQPKFCGCLLMLTVLLFAAGCSKSGSPSPSAVSSDSTKAFPTNSAAQAPVATTQQAVATNSDGTQSTLQTLNRALLGWMIKNHRHPQNFAEFASSANIQIPDPPEGEKYTLNAHGFIVLVNN